MSDPAAQIPLLRLDLTETLRELVTYHGDRPWTDRDLSTAADVLATTVETRRSVDPVALVAYLDAWGATMTTAKARWAAGWAAETVRKAMRDPSMLDRHPPESASGTSEVPTE